LDSLRLETVPTGTDFGYDDDPGRQLDSLYYPLADALQPLRMLRNIYKLEFAAVEGDDIPTYNPPPDALSSTPSPLSLDPELVAELKSLVEGKSKVVHVWKTYERLVTYAQGFERNLVFKAAMKSGYGEARRRVDLRMTAHSPTPTAMSQSSSNVGKKIYIMLLKTCSNMPAQPARPAV
jgi:hypothetical protein